jgi:hypothetical protein
LPLEIDARHSPRPSPEAKIDLLPSFASGVGHPKQIVSKTRARELISNKKEVMNDVENCFSSSFIVRKFIGKS